MAEYIEREAAKEFLAQDYAYAAAKLLDYMPAADVVEVVRCKDRKWWMNGRCNGITFYGDDASYVETEETDFCSYGEAKMDGKGEGDG